MHADWPFIPHLRNSLTCMPYAHTESYAVLSNFNRLYAFVSAFFWPSFILLSECSVFHNLFYSFDAVGSMFFVSFNLQIERKCRQVQWMKRRHANVSHFVAHIRVLHRYRFPEQFPTKLKLNLSWSKPPSQNLAHITQMSLKMTYKWTRERTKPNVTGGIL